MEKNFKAIMIDTAKKSYTGKDLKKNIRNFNMFSFLLKPKSFERFIIQAQACKMHNAINEIGKIKANTLIIAGKKDLILGYEGSKILHEKIENSSLLLYEEYSHGLYEQAKDFNEKVYNFLISE